jgi:hypothetical protein
VSRTIGGVALLVLAALMLLGFTRSSLAIGSPSVIAALLLTVVAPAVGGIALLRRRSAESPRTRALRQQALEAEILRLATQQRGRLTALEVATELALTPEEAKATLDGFVTREIADLAMTDRGVLVYTFHETQGAADKHGARGLLDA